MARLFPFILKQRPLKRLGLFSLGVLSTAAALMGVFAQKSF
ncbi:MAG: hypothetical protein RI953_649, partial [Pseudomonadota bacterium]